MTMFFALLLAVIALHLDFALKKEQARIALARKLDGTPIKLETVPDGIYMFLKSCQDRMFLRDIMSERVLEVPAPSWNAKLPEYTRYENGRWYEFEME